MSEVDIKNLTIGGKKKHPYVIYKAFTSDPSSGNPAAVVVLPPASSSFADLTGKDIKRLFPSDEALHDTAKELALPMTAFLVPLDAKNGKYALRWFYAAGEAELCGHATMALSGYLFTSSDHPPSALELQTVYHGLVRSLNVEDPFKSGEKVVALDFPELLDFEERERGSERWKVVLERVMTAAPNLKEEDLARIDETPGRMLVQIKEGVDLKGLNIDPKKLNPTTEKKVFEDGQYFIPFQIAPASDDPSAPQLFSRCINTNPAFAEEDAATGSAHCAIIPQALTNPACLEALRKNHPTSDFGGKGDLSQTVRVRQVSKEGGEMIVQWLKEKHTVRIMGHAVEIKKGEVEV